MPTGERTDPLRAFNFRLEIDGLEIGSFSEFSGATAEGESVDYREGTDRNNSVRKLPGLRTYTNVTLKRGITQNDELFRWYTSIANGISDRRNGTVILMNEARQDMIRWSFENAFPNKYEGPTLSASGNEIAIETLELVHEKLTMEIA